MIHSLAGGELGKDGSVDIAKVEYVTEYNGKKVGYYLIEQIKIKVGDIVIVPVGRQLETTKAKVVRIDNNVSIKCTPFPFKMMKAILKVEK